MQSFIRYSLLLLTSCLFLPSQAQKLDHCLGELLVSFSSNESPNRVQDYIKHNLRLKSKLEIEPLIDFPFAICKIKFDPFLDNEYEILERIKSIYGVADVQFNHLIENRAIPNDPLFGSQWHLVFNNDLGVDANANIQASEAWDITTGGLSASGDTIVACIIDDGVDLFHEDLIDNIWINHAEIDDNGIDDDNNGYIDDRFGWNALRNNGDITNNGHGTKVVGLVGAVGNNNIGISGVNWNIKMMNVIKGTDEASVLESYGYVYNMRKLYNDSNGENGAFVVVTNSSWGIDYGNPDNFPIWCDFYNKMGEVGILSCASTINAAENVDVVGDMPTGCSSDYLIGVTNINKTNNLADDTGYGTESIDLGSYGDETFTTYPNNEYGLFFDASAACPSVSGVVALMYSAPCLDFANLVKQDPSTAALLVKDIIIDGATSNTSLLGLTKFKSVVNALKPLNLLMDNCNGCNIVTNVSLQFTDNNVIIDWRNDPDHTEVNLRIASSETEDWVFYNNIEAPFIFSDLLDCTTYKLEFQPSCSSETNEYFGTTSFKTQGCCILKQQILLAAEADNSVYLEWEELSPIREFFVYYKEENELLWEGPKTTTNNFITISNLDICKSYVFQVKLFCSDQPEFTSNTQPISTNCGECNSSEYCDVIDLNAEFEWIQSIEINQQTFDSGNDDGYGFFPNNDFRLKPEELVNFKINPGFSFSEFQEVYTIYLDVNQNKVFEEDEKVYEYGPISLPQVIGSFTVPGNIQLGYTRMRVMMSFQEGISACNLNGFSSNGEIEDYCILIQESTNAQNLDRPKPIIGPNPFTDQLYIDQVVVGSTINIYNVHGALVHSDIANNTNHLISSLAHMEDGAYIITVHIIGKRAYSKVIIKG